MCRLRQCCCHPGLMVTGVQGTDVEEGLEEALDGLSLSDDLRVSTANGEGRQWVFLRHASHWCWGLCIAH